MDLFGFKCAKNTLMILNGFYIIVGIMLAAISGHLITSNKVTSLPIIGGIVACGIFLIVISAIGIYGAARHHQVLLFFYMIVLFLIFFIQFVVACVCLGISTDSEHKFAELGWQYSTDSVKSDVQHSFECCGYKNFALNDTDVMGHPDCSSVPLCIHQAMNGTDCTKADKCCTLTNPSCGCDPCEDKIGEVIESAFHSVGVTSLLFSFTEFIGIWLTMRYRNMAPKFSNRDEFQFH